MATKVTRSYDTSSISVNTGTNLVEGTRQRLIRYETEPDQVKGKFIELPGGGKFRLATNYYRSNAWIEPGAPQTLRGIKTVGSSTPRQVVTSIDSSPGGYLPDSGLYGASAKPAFAVEELGMGELGARPSIPTMSRNEAVTKALNDIANGKANLGESLGTMGQTFQMLRNPLGTLVRGVRSAKDNKSLKPFLRETYRSLRKKGPIKGVAEKYLEYIYGWRPLMAEIYDLVEFMKETGQGPLLIHGSATARRQGSSSGGSMRLTSNSAQTDIDPMMLSSKVTCNLWATPDPDWAGLRALNRLGLANPLATAWELVSLSFVVDWVLPIGPVLNALSAPAGLRFVNGSISNRVSGHSSLTHWNYSQDSNATSNVKATANVRYEGYNREVINAWPRPGLWIDQDPLRGDRSLAALALMITRLRS